MNTTLITTNKTLMSLIATCNNDTDVSIVASWINELTNISVADATDIIYFALGESNPEELMSDYVCYDIICDDVVCDNTSDFVPSTSSYDWREDMIVCEEESFDYIPF